MLKPDTSDKVRSSFLRVVAPQIVHLHLRNIIIGVPYVIGSVLCGETRKRRATCPRAVGTADLNHKHGQHTFNKGRHTHYITVHARRHTSLKMRVVLQAGRKETPHFSAKDNVTSRCLLTDNQPPCTTSIKSIPSSGRSVDQQKRRALPTGASGCARPTVAAEPQLRVKTSVDVEKPTDNVSEIGS